MATLVRFLMSLVVHMAWQRMGKGGPIPRLRTPKGKTVVLPTLAPWQIMAATWVAKKAWERYGHAVKSRINSVDNHWVKQAGGLLPDPPGTPAQNSAASTPATPPTPPAAPAPPRPTPQYGTQVLPSNGAPQTPNTNASSNGNTDTLPAGSVLSGLRQAPGTTG